jgi:hypothetical protein
MLKKKRYAIQRVQGPRAQALVSGKKKLYIVAIAGTGRVYE